MYRDKQKVQGLRRLILFTQLIANVKHFGY